MARDAAAWNVLAEARVQAGAVASAALRAEAVGALLLGMLLVFGWWLRREKALGRNTPPTPQSQIDAAWLDRHVFSLSPELAGAAYDGRIAGPEVAAVVARLCGEGKLASRVAAGARGWNNLELWLLVERDELSGYERALIDHLFIAGKVTTSTDLLQLEYRGVGFEPASILRRLLKEACDAKLGLGPALRWPFGLALVHGAAAVGLLLMTRSAAPGAILPLLAGATGMVGPLSAAFIFAPRYRRDPEQSPSGARAIVAAAGASVMAVALLIATLPSLPASAPLAVAAWGVLGVVLVAVAAASRESAEGLAWRRHLFAARRFFATELARPEPRLRDEWLPYLIALDLTSEVDRWFQAFGRIETAARRQRLVSRRVEAVKQEPASSWTGGAGAFGGVGPSGPWIAASAGLAVVARRKRRTLGLELERGLELGWLELRKAR
jgi:hypothetical protein